jgi:hypothetical protein
LGAKQWIAGYLMQGNPGTRFFGDFVNIMSFKTAVNDESEERRRVMHSLRS